MSDLTVTLRLIDQFSERMTGASVELGAFGRGLDKTIGTLKTLGSGIAAAFAINEIKNATQAAIDFGDKIYDGSRKLGLGIEKYQELSYIAKQSGTNIDGMGRAFITLAKEAEKSNKILGISTRDANGNLKDMGSLFQEVVGRLAEIENPTIRAAEAQKIFGKAAQDVFNIASLGKDKIAELTEETKKYGLILDSPTVKILNDAKKAQDRLNVSISVMAAKFAGPFIPQFTKFVDKVGEFVAHMPKVELPWNIEANKQKANQIASIIKQLTDLEKLGKKIDEPRKQYKTQLESQYENLTGDKWKNNAPDNGDNSNKTKEKAFDLPGFSKLSIDMSHKAWDEQEKEDKEKWRERINIWKTSIKQIDDVEKQRLENEKIINKEVEQLEKQKVDFEIACQKRTWEATWSMTFALDNLAKMGIEKSKMNANAKKDILVAMSIGEAAASAVKGISQVWEDNTGGSVWGNIAMTAVVAAEVIAEAWSQIDTIQSTHFAMGTRNAPGGWSMVGEHGPESMYVPHGASIYNANETRNMTNNSGHTFHITLNATSSVAETLHTEIRAGDQGVTKLVNLIASKIGK